ncbi:MAG: hypothetical protein ACRDRJ_11850 [Streptosporangiaceae bacterium]
MTHAPADEAALLDQAQAGDQSAFSGLVTRYEAGSGCIATGCSARSRTPRT